MVFNGRNISFPIHNEDGSSFHGLELRNATFESVVMALDDKISGDVYYKDNSLSYNMREYIEFTNDSNETIRFYLVNPPTIVREGMASDNGDLKGMTKYSFEFYHPMYMLANFPFTDIAVTSDELRYKSQDKTFYWIGYLSDFVAKLNKNLQNTEWVVIMNPTIPEDKLQTLSEVLPFDKNSIADALKTAYETWEVPYIVDNITSGEYFDDDQNDYYELGKRFAVFFGLPSNKIYASDEDKALDNHFTFRFGKGLGLKNNSAAPRNNKIITRLAGYGSENNIPFGYPQIVWQGNSSWEFTINNDGNNPLSYPIYDGIVGGEVVRLIKHPFTRSHLMPTVYVDTINKKVNPYAQGYDPNIEIVDYHDAEEGLYPNPINLNAVSFENHEFEKIKPEFGEHSIVGVSNISNDEVAEIINDNEDIPWGSSLYTHTEFVDFINKLYPQQDYTVMVDSAEVKEMLLELVAASNWNSAYYRSTSGGHFCKLVPFKGYLEVSMRVIGFEGEICLEPSKYSQSPTPTPTPTGRVIWDDSMDDEGNYKQSYFKITLPILSFDIYACAAITQEMQINMRSGACLGCTFEVMVDWDDYKANFYDDNGKFSPNGRQRDLTKYPNSKEQQIELILQKDMNTFGIIMPNIYQYPQESDKFTILGISLPLEYIADAQLRLDQAIDDFLLENNVYYFDYPIKCDELYLALHPYIRKQIRPNSIFNFEFADKQIELYIKQFTIKFGENKLPQYDITLTDEIEVVLNQIGQVVENVAKLESSVYNKDKDYNQLLKYNLAQKLSKVEDDTALGFITFKQGLGFRNGQIDNYGRAIFNSVSSAQFASGLNGSGWRAWMQDGLSQLEVDNVTIRKVMNVAELLIHKIRATGGEVLVSAADGKITSVDGNVITLEDVDGNRTTMFRVGDYVRCQRWDAWLDRTFGYWLKVTAASGMNLTLDIENRRDGMTDTPQIGDEIVLLGSTSPARQGAVRISATEGGVPVVDVLSGIDKPTAAGCLKARLGGLDGIVDEAFGQNQPQGYGLYANNAYLKGVLVLANGEEVGSKFGVLEDRVQSIVTGMSEDNNLLSNPTFDTMEDWSIKRDVETKPTVHALLNSSSVSQLFLGDSILMTDEGFDGSIITQKDGRRCLYLKAWDELLHKTVSAEIQDMEFVRVVMEVWSLPDVETLIYVRNGLLAPALEEWSAIATGGWRTISIDLDRQTLTKYLTAFTFYANDDIYISNIWLGVPTESKIEQTADRIEMSVKSGLNEAGINIEDKKITLKAENTEVEGDFEVTRLRTKPAEGQQARVEIADNLIKVFGAAGIANIVFGIENGYAVLKYYDNNGNFLYNLGPNGLGQISVREERLTEIIYLNADKSANVTLWVYTAKMVQGQIDGGTKVPDPVKAAEADGLVFTSETIYSSGDLVNKADGTYWRKDEIVITNLNKDGGVLPSDFPQTPSGGGTWDLSFDESAPIDDTLVYPLHQQTKVEITNGVSTETIWYWQNKN